MMRRQRQEATATLCSGATAASGLARRMSGHTEDTQRGPDQERTDRGHMKEVELWTVYRNQGRRAMGWVILLASLALVIVASLGLLLALCWVLTRQTAASEADR